MTSSGWWPAWLAMAIAGLVAFNQAIAESKKFASLLGGWGRKMHDRARSRYQMDTAEFNAAVRDAVADERARWDSEEARALTMVEGRLKYVTEITETQQKELQELSWSLRCHTAYTEYEADWHHKLRMKVVQANRDGGKIPIGDLPDHRSYYEFETLCKDKGNLNWRTWDELKSPLVK